MKGKRIERRTLRVRHGIEGPSYDPYRWTEYIVIQNRLKIIYKDGMIPSVTMNGENMIRFNHSICEFSFFEYLCEKEFEVLTGIKVKEFMRHYEEILRRRMRSRCSCPNTNMWGYVEGMPGETLVYCHGCKSVLDTAFDESAVI